MGSTGVLRTFGQLFAVCMFIYQMVNAVSKLYHRPTVISTTTLSVDQIEPPLIIVCPVDQFNITNLNLFGYAEDYEFFNGRVQNMNDSLSWGHHVGKSYQAMMNELSNVEAINILEELNSFIPTKRGIFSYFGYCLELEPKSLDHLVMISNLSVSSNIEVFITDRNTKHYLNMDMTSQIGNMMKMPAQESTLETFRVKIDLYDTTETADEDDCEPSTKYNYSQCVENKIKEDLLPKLNCIPPLLSPNNPCKVTLIDELTMKYLEESYIYPLGTQTRNNAEKKCKKPCIQQVRLQSQVHMQCLLDYKKLNIHLYTNNLE
jgi:hypothetical protein